jgi:hypothetical protein
MVIEVFRHTNLYFFPPGRGIHALEQVLAGAARLNLPRIVMRANAGIGLFHEVLELQTRFRTGRTSLYGADTIELDNLLDRSLTAVDSHLDGQIRLFSEDHPRAVAAGTIRPALFPEGVLPITSQSFVQQRVTVDRMIGAYQAPELAPSRASLPELDPMMARVAEINVQYGASIDGYDRDRPNGEKLRAAQEAAQACLAETMVLIMAEYIDSPPERRESVAALLEPILRQNEAVRASRRRRQPAQDVEPGTGIELPASEPTANPPA